MYTSDLYRVSFDRFGCDLSEFILSYLPISVCFRLQGVNKLFKNLIFNKQKKLTLSDGNWFDFQLNENENFFTFKELILNFGLKKHRPSINYKLLKYVLNKYFNINSILIDGNCFLSVETIIILRNSCKLIKYLVILLPFGSQNLLLESFEDFALNCLHMLESLTIESTETKILKTIIKFCPKLKVLCSESDIEVVIDQFIINKESFCSNLESVSFYCAVDEKFITFSNYFKNQLKSLFIVFFEIDIIIMKNLTKFEFLEYLCCSFEYQDKKQTELLKQIGLKCCRLKIFELENFKSPLKGAFNNFKSLKKLNIENCILEDNIEYIKTLTNLTHFKTCSDYPIENEFKNIHLYLLNLRYVDICYDKNTKNENILNVLKVIASLPKLYVLKYGCFESTLSEKEYFICGVKTEYVITFIDNCQLIRKITIYPKLALINTIFIEKHIESLKRKIQINTENFVFLQKNFN